jgi:2-haloacid dehalogenase
LSYKLFLFDADDTLFDFKASERSSFFTVLKEFAIEGELEKIYESYVSESALLWRQLEKGEVSKEFLRTERFKRVFKKFKLDESYDQASSRYLEILPTKVVLIDGAIDLCRELSSQVTIGIVTNGIANVQYKRLENSGLDKFVSFTVVSEECGAVKPDPKFFEYTMSLAPDFSKKDAIVIGDRLETDIDGANKFGIDSCWFNPNKKENLSSVIPKFEIDSLLKVRDFLK